MEIGSRHVTVVCNKPVNYPPTRRACIIRKLGILVRNKKYKKYTRTKRSNFSPPKRNLSSTASTQCTTTKRVLVRPVHKLYGGWWGGAPARRATSCCRLSSGRSRKNEGSADLMKLRRFSLLSDESSPACSLETRERQSARGADAQPHLRTDVFPGRDPLRIYADDFGRG